jgi:hypothetical protein
MVKKHQLHCPSSVEFLDSKATGKKFEIIIGAVAAYDCFSPEFTDDDDDDDGGGGDDDDADDDDDASISTTGCLVGKYAEWNEKYPINKSRVNFGKLEFNISS